ncbi:hypothetical protein FACS1894151_10120 [Spirochaetia bacterium]|nr:hypothetical protein FACS1894151_10120 [Spirochaetia bacterium]
MADSTDFDNDIFLNMIIRKADPDKDTDENGNYIFEVEASNENLDLQGQVVLQRALMGSKKHFLEDGVISYDHLHKRRGANGQVISDPSMVIGEPIEVKTDGKRTIVVGKLYKGNEIARDLIQKLKDGSTRVKASVGGIFPKVVKDAKTGIEKITSVLWNDLALTFSPVNATVGSAMFARSMNPDEFVKALLAGGGTDHQDFTGGRALIPEDMRNRTVNVTETGGDTALEGKIRSLVAALSTGEIKGHKQAIKYLEKQGVDNDLARAAVRDISIFMGDKS